MSLPHLLLGLLRSPASGYELKHQLDDLYSHAWNADLPQIYRTLNRMERDRWLSVAPERSDKGPDRRIYSRTAVGEQALRDWLAPSPRVEVERSPHLVLTALLGEASDPRAALDSLHALRSEFEAALQALQATARAWAGADPSYPDCRDEHDFFRQLTLDARIHELAARIAWASRCIHRVEARIRVSGGIR